MMPVQTDDPDDYKTKYKTLKRKLKLLIYENECFQEELRKAQRALLRVRRDKSFLLDRLLQYHRGPDSSSDSEQTEESDTEMDAKIEAKSCRKRLSMESSVSGSVNTHGSSNKPPSKKKKSSSSGSSSSKSSKHSSSSSSGSSNKQTSSPHMTSSSPHMTSSSPHMNMGSTIIGSESAQATSSITTNVSAPGTLVPKVTGSTLSAGSLAALSARRQVVATGGITPSDGQLSREEVERRLAARQPMNDFTTTVSLTLPNQLFSDNILDGDLMDEEVETSPSNVEEDVTVDNYD